MSLLLGIDVGTSHCKAGLFTLRGEVLRIATCPMQAQHDPDGFFYYPVAQVQQTLHKAVAGVLDGQDSSQIVGVGIASMAETGLLVDRASLEPLTPLFPWFDTSASPQAAWLAEQDDPLRRFSRSGLYPGFKVSLARLVWLKQRRPEVFERAVWLCMADAAASWLTGKMVTDPSLAGRTYAFRLDRQEWDAEWLRSLGFSADLFPPVLPAGALAGRILPGPARWLRLPEGLPVAIAGHDHIAASYAAGVFGPGLLFDSLGTAEALLGVVEAHPLGAAEHATGLSFGCHLIPGRLYWLGGLSASGGSLDWLRRILADPALTYDQLDILLGQGPLHPGGILYLPYLAGAGSPRHEPGARAALVGLDSTHTRADLAQAVLEGVAFEVEMMRRAGEKVSQFPLKSIRAAGGGTRLPVWMQLRADITGCSYTVLAIDELTLLGAALCGGMAGGVFQDALQAQAGLAPQPERIYAPDPARHEAYQRWFERGYLPLQAPLRQFYQSLKEQS